MPIQIFTTKTCHYCQKAKDFFTSKGLAYEVFDISEDAEKKKQILDAGFMSVPVIKIGDKMISGFNPTEIEAALA